MLIKKLAKYLLLFGSIGGIILINTKLPKKKKQTTIDLLICNGTVLPMTQQKDIIQNGAVAVNDGNIIAVGPMEKLKNIYKGKQNIDAQGGVILPGLINTHTHAAMTLFRGLADDLPLMEWIKQYILPLEKKNVSADLVYWGTRLACCEMIKGGTTTFVDMYFFEEKVAQAAYDIGMRAIVGETIVGFPSPDSPSCKEGFERTKLLVEKWKNNELITPAVAPHAPYTCRQNILVAAKKFSDEHNVPLLIHLCETKDEIKQIIEKEKMRPVAYLESLGVLCNRLIAAHCIHVNNDEIKLLQQKGVGVAHAPVSNMKLSCGIAPIYKMLQEGVLVGLGTDGAASNNSLDMIAEMKTATLLQKVATEKPTALPAYQALELATIKGAKAIHMDDQIGSIELGKKADIIIVAMDKIHQLPVYNIVSQLVYATKATDVQTVIINGKIVMTNRIMLPKDQLDKLKMKIQAFKQKMQ